MSPGPSRRAYRLLLRLLPRPLRERHGAAMEELFAETLRRERRRRGAAGWLRAWSAGGWDVLGRAAYERARSFRAPRPRGGFMSTLSSDLRFAFRGFVRQPGITLLVVTMLALGIGAATAVFSLVNGLLLRPFPFPEPDRLVYLNETAPRWNLERTGISFADFAAWRHNARVFEAMGIFATESYNLSDGTSSERVEGADVTWDLAPALGVVPILGRGFTPEEDRPGAAPVVVIGHDLWRRRFAGAPDVLGRTLRIDGVERTVVGVLPPEAEFPGRVDLWLPLALDSAETVGSFSYEGVGRLRPGVTPEEARADLLRAHVPVWEDRDTARVVSPTLAPLRETLVSDFRSVAVALALAVALVLVIACANVASVLLARSFARRREFGIRLALGAQRGRIARQLLTESLALSLAAGPLGVLLGFLSTRALVASVPDELPGWLELGVDWRMGLFGVAVVVGTAILFGWAPVLQLRRDRPAPGGGEGGPRASASRAQRRTMHLLVIGEVMLAAVLLVSGGLLLRAFDRLREVDPGFRTEDVLAFRLELPASAYPDSASRQGFYRDLLARLDALPGVRATGAVTCPPLTCHWGGFFEAEGEAPEPGESSPVVLYRYSTPDYFEAMGIRLSRGRFFSEADGRPGAPPVVVANEEFVRHFFPAGEDPVGRRIRVSGDDEGPSYTVVGVTPDVRHYGLDEEMRPGLYFPLAPEPQRSLGIVMWTAVPPSSLVAPARRVVREMDPALPLFQVGTTGEAVERSLAVRRAYSGLMAAFAGMALVLALGGIYGVLSYLVGQRSREIGIRVALGATRRRVLAMVVRQGMTLALVGLALGLGAALGAGRVMSGLLYGVSARDPATFGAVAALLALAALLASLVPARRALAVEPQVVLREE